MCLEIQAFELAKFTNEEKTRLINVLKHLGASEIKEDNLGRIFAYFGSDTVVLEKERDLNNGKFYIKAQIESSTLEHQIAEHLSTLKLVDEITIVNEEAKIIRVSKINKEVKSDKPSISNVKTVIRKLSTTIVVFFFRLIFN